MIRSTSHLAAASATPLSALTNAASATAGSWVGSVSRLVASGSRPASRAIVHALNAVAANVSFVEIESDKGHDAFLLDDPRYMGVVRSYFESIAGATS